MAHNCHNSSSRESNTLPWPLGALHTYGAHTYMCTKIESLPGGRTVFSSDINSCLSYLARIHCSFKTLKRELLVSCVYFSDFPRPCSGRWGQPSSSPPQAVENWRSAGGLVLCSGGGVSCALMCSSASGFYLLDAGSFFSADDSRGICGLRGTNCPLAL